MAEPPPFAVNARFSSQRITGAQRYALEIARHLKRLEPTAVLLAPPDADPALAAEIGAEVVGRRRGVAWEQIDLPRALRERGSPPLIGLSFTVPMRYRPTIVTVHDVCFLHREWVSRRFHYYYRWLVPYLCRRAHTVVTVSEFSKGEIHRRLGVPTDKIEVIGGAVAPEFVRMASDVPAHDHGAYVLGAASLQRRKNFETLIRGFCALPRQDVSLVLAGGVDRKVYGGGAGLAAELDDPRIVLAGYVSDAELAALYRDARVFVFPSLYEGFGIPPLEAMAMGCPVISSRAASLPEVCGDAAHYIDPQDVAGTTAAIERVLGDEGYREQLVVRGRARVQQFDWQRSAERYLDLVRRVGENRAP